MTERKKVRPVQQMLDDPNKGISKTYGSWGTLSKLWRIILHDNRINGYRFSVLMDRFIKDPKNHTKRINNAPVDTRGNLHKEFSNPAMSWKVFVKCMKFMQFSQIRITIEARQLDGQISKHMTLLDLDDNVLLNDPRFIEELTDEERAALAVPEDQEPIPWLDTPPEEQ